MSQDKPKKKAGPARKLPASGLAEDILGTDTPKEASDSGEANAASDSDQGEAEAKSRPAKPATRKRGRKKPQPSSAPTPQVSQEEPAPPGPDRIYAFADELASQTTEEEVAAEELKPYITFRLARETFAIPVEDVQEVVEVGAITRVPHAPYPVRGVMNRRGGVLPVVDLRLRFGLEGSEVEPSNRVLVVVSKRRLIGVLVDTVLQVAQLTVSAIEAPPADIMHEHSEYVRGVLQTDDSLLILLDVDRTLETHEGNG